MGLCGLGVWVAACMVFDIWVACKFWLHKHCAYQQLPPQVSHPLHSQHSLSLLTFPRYFSVCDKCFSVTRGYFYKCLHCDFNLDLICASQTTTHDETLAQRSNPSYKKAHHFIHSHELTPFYYRKVGKDHSRCDWCEKLILSVSGGISSYGCFYCGFNDRDVFFHESCLINIPTIISKHHFHPSHPLYIRIEGFNHFPVCNACKGQIQGVATYSCENCQFYLHVHCGKLQPSLKLDVHEHHLAYFRVKDYSDTLLCKKCNERIDDDDDDKELVESIFYACVQCDFILHFSCTSIPFGIEHEYHRHELKLNHSFIEDVSDEYYCDICEKERRPKESVYCCEKCTFAAHIGCALNKFIDTQLMKPMEQEETKNKNANFPSHLKIIDHFDHQHPLTFYDVLERNENLFCKACCLKISDQVYCCESCEYYLHKTCTQLPYQLLHPLHLHHSLKLYNARWLSLTCNECRDCSDGFAYVCFLCDFMLDMKCVSLSVPKNATFQSPKEKDIGPPKLCPFNQDHKLYFTNYGSKSNVRYHPYCSFCRQQVVGPSYECFSCGYELHESCLGFPLEMQLQFHQLHPFYTYLPDRKWLLIVCRLCNKMIGRRRFSYSCKQCDLHLHPGCAKSLVRVVKSKSHHHNLYYFGPYNVCDEYYYYGGKKVCGECKERISGTPFYFCMECDFKMHFECAQIPHSVKSKYHIHSLTLEDHIVEDDSREYYCDICEEELCSETHVYCCEECRGLFVAHIDCVLTSTSVEETAAAILETSSNDFEKTSSQTEGQVSTDYSTQGEEINFK
ncbi:hypothetical protein PTKIN_Ptkin06aG0173100 [Pterospermum kingtungense]